MKEYDKPQARGYAILLALGLIVLGCSFVWGTKAAGYALLVIGILIFVITATDTK